MPIDIIVRSGGRAVERRTVSRGDGGSNPPTAVSKLKAISFTPQLPVSFGRDTKRRRSLVSGVYGRGSKRSHTCTCVTCSGLTNSHWTLKHPAKGPVQYLREEEKRRKQHVYSLIPNRQLPFFLPCPSPVVSSVSLGSCCLQYFLS